MFNEFIGKFLGPKKIKSVEVTEHKTPLGKDILKVSFEDGSWEETTKFMLEATAKDEATDFNKLVEARIMGPAQQILGILTEWHVKMSEVDHVVNKIVTTINVRFEQANAFLWKRDNYDRTIADLSRVLMESEAQKSTSDGKSPTA